MTTRTWIGLAATLALGSLVAAEEPTPEAEPTGGAAARTVSVPEPGAATRQAGFVYLGLNDAGAEEWFRVRDASVVIRVPGGEYMKRPYEGWEAEEDPSPVNVGSFLVDKFEVTNERFARFLNTCKDPARLFDPEVPGIVRQDGSWAAAQGRARYPVTCATGHGAVEYARWVGGRLPTQTEWEKAAGGAEGKLYPWGDGLPDDNLANFATVKASGPAAVGSRAAGASPYGCLDMAGNVYERAWMRWANGKEEPVMIKGGSWVSPSPLNLRVLDMCVQPMGVAEVSVGFRVFVDDPEPEREPLKDKAKATLRLATTWAAAVKEAKSRRVPIFVALLHETCGQSDRTRVQLFSDPRFIAYCNEHMVVAVGHHPYHAEYLAHEPDDAGACPLYPGLTCAQHMTVYARAVKVVGGFVTSPGNFVLHPDRCEEAAGQKAVLIAEGRLPKWGNAVKTYLDRFEEARSMVAE